VSESEAEPGAKTGPTTGAEPLFRDISDTARWVAIYRAHESERPDAHFKDPFARRLSGERGARMEAAMPEAKFSAWAFVARTVAFDEIVLAEGARGVDLVVNLAAGLDARPYRLELPAKLKWIEVDLPALIEAKSAELHDEKPHCALERIAADLSDADARRRLLQEIGARGRDALVVTEGLIAYFSEDEVATFARDLAAVPSFSRWVVDFGSPRLLKLLQRGLGAKLAAAGMPLQFGPADGPEFFLPHGWRLKEVKSSFLTAKRLHRLPFFLSMLALLPEGSKPWRSVWAGNCLFERARA